MRTMSRTLLATILFVALSMPQVSMANVVPSLPQPAKTVRTDAPLDGEASIRLSEVAPIAADGGVEWVELYRPRAAHITYLPSVRATGVSSETADAAEPAATGDPDVSGWQLSDLDGNAYTIPAALPPIPAGGRVLLLIDGLGAGHDDYDLSDRMAVLHTSSGFTGVLDDTADQVALYTGSDHSPATIRDFVAYGGPAGADESDAVGADLWVADGYTGPTAVAPGNDVLGPGGSIGVFPGDHLHAPGDWVVYHAGQPSPGKENTAPSPYFRNPPDGIETTDRQMPFGWSNVAGAELYAIQVDDDPGFDSPLFTQFVAESSFTPAESMPLGIYHARVVAIQADGRTSGWSPAIQISYISVASAAAPGSQRLLNVTPQLQHKDSRMICLDGHNETGQHRWDSAHEDDGDWIVGNGTAVRGEPHDDMYCTRAAISMIVDYFGGSLSQDRISYFHFGGGAPEDDLGHGIGLWPCESGSWSGGDCVFGWALNGTAPTSSRGKPTYAQTRGWIDANRPILIVENNDQHSVVMDGYDTSGTLAHRVDPWTGSSSWVSWNSWSVSEYHVPPAGAAVRSDEANFATDADGDGITDFDENNRFPTDATLADSDGDWVQDKADLREYIFDAAGAYSTRNADQDGDSLRKEMDPDNDNDSSVDGCEDTNYNGKYEAGLGETHNFSAASHQACVPTLDILQPTQTNPVNAGAFGSPDKILVQVKVGLPPAAYATTTFTAADFDVSIGGLDSPVTAAYQVYETYFLVVSPHTQSAADYYDLSVTLTSGQTDSETRAIFYLPRLRADEVVVMDRSGSMIDYGKLDAAKNAARAFIDHAGINDMIGVVSFATTAGPAPDYALTTIAGDAQYNAAKAAVTGLSAGGATALGQGVQLGYSQLTSLGQADHDWAMALLSDGMENISPYWSDATVSGVIVPSRVAVHTVALGYDADETLLGAIASQTGGTSYQAGVDLLPLLAASEATLADEGSYPVENAPAAMPGPNIPATLSNRLADVYRAMGEQIGHQQRLWERTGTVSGHLVFEVPVEKGLPEAIFAVNWDSTGSPITFTLFDPNGTEVKAGYPGMQRLDDATHSQYRIPEPKSGVWVVDLRTREKLADYLFTLSARSDVTMHLAFGLPPAERTVGAQMPILVALSDLKPIPGAEVWAYVQGPNSDLVQLLQLFDDGAHQDGRSGDGIYGNLFTRMLKPGAYVVKASAWGSDNAGDFFVRHRTGGFTALPRAAYIWKDDLTTARQYKALLQANGFVVDLVHIDAVSEVSWGGYSLALIGPETGADAEWGTTKAVAALAQYPVRIIGLGEGGYAFFGKLRLDIGYANGWHGDETRVYAVDPASQVWTSPYEVPVPRPRVVELYKRTSHVGVYIPKPDESLELIGREPTDENHYTIARQGVRFLLWGYDGAPLAMLEEGRHLFVNISRYMAGM